MPRRETHAQMADRLALDIRRSVLAGVRGPWLLQKVPQAVIEMLIIKLNEGSPLPTFIYSKIRRLDYIQYVDYSQAAVDEGSFLGILGAMVQHLNNLFGGGGDPKDN